MSSIFFSTRSFYIAKALVGMGILSVAGVRYIASVQGVPWYTVPTCCDFLEI